MREWADWFEGVSIITPTGGETVLIGDLPDQSALYGLLAKLRDLRFGLRSVQTSESVNPGQ